MSTLLVLGAGGHGRVVADAALRTGRWGEVSATDRNPARCSRDLLPGVHVESPAVALAAATAVHIAIGNAQARQAETESVGAQWLTTVTHPDASVSASAQIGAGCFVAARSVIAPLARLGIGVIVNHGAVVDHDVEVGDFCHIAPNAALGGNVRLGKRVLVGTGASILPGITICDDVTIGAGSVIIASIAASGIYAGVPARRVR